MNSEEMVSAIQRIVTSTKLEYHEAIRSGDSEWIEEVRIRLSQMNFVCGELNIDYGELVCGNQLSLK